MICSERADGAGDRLSDDRFQGCEDVGFGSSGEANGPPVGRQELVGESLSATRVSSAAESRRAMPRVAIQSAGKCAVLSVSRMSAPALTAAASTWRSFASIATSATVARSSASTSMRAYSM